MAKTHDGVVRAVLRRVLHKSQCENNVYKHTLFMITISLKTIRPSKSKLSKRTSHL